MRWVKDGQGGCDAYPIDIMSQYEYVYMQDMQGDKDEHHDSCDDGGWQE